MGEQNMNTSTAPLPEEDPVILRQLREQKSPEDDSDFSVMKETAEQSGGGAYVHATTTTCDQANDFLGRLA